jgi:hypothetical protein
MNTYAIDNKQRYPRTFADDGQGYSHGGPRYFSGPLDESPFDDKFFNCSTGAVSWTLNNDVTASMYLLVHYKMLNVDVFLCPSSNQQHDVAFDPITLVEVPAVKRSNFSDQPPYSWSLSYCFATPFYQTQDDIDQESRYRHGPDAPAENAIAADRNDGLDRWFTTNPNAPQRDMEMINSRNHKGKGQNVLFNDSHVAWCNNAFVGYNRDNIYTSASPLRFPENSAMKHVPSNRYDSNLGPQLPLKNNAF